MDREKAFITDDITKEVKKMLEGNREKFEANKKEPEHFEKDVLECTFIHIGKI